MGRIHSWPNSRAKLKLYEPIYHMVCISKQYLKRDLGNDVRKSENPFMDTVSFTLSVLTPQYQKSTRDFIHQQLIHSLSNSYTSTNIFGVSVLMLFNATMISSFNCSACQGIKRSDKLPPVIQCMSPIKLISIQLSHSFWTTLCIKYLSC